jgi:uncharacterized protein YuzE
MKVSAGPYTFDNVSYDTEVDVLYLHMGDPSTAADFDEPPESHALRFDADGNMVGVTILNAKSLIERDGELTISIAMQIQDERLKVAAAINLVADASMISLEKMGDLLPLHLFATVGYGREDEIARWADKDRKAHWTGDR